MSSLKFWKVIRDNELLFEGNIELTVSYLKQLGDQLEVVIDVNKLEIIVFESNFNISKSQLISIGMKQRQLSEFKKQRGYVDDPNYKFCTGCSISKPIYEFGFRSNSSDGRARRCKECINKKAKRSRRKLKK